MHSLFKKGWLIVQKKGVSYNLALSYNHELGVCRCIWTECNDRLLYHLAPFKYF